MIKSLCLILICFCFHSVSGQILDKKNSELVSVTKSTYHFNENKNFKTQKWRKSKTGLVTFKFDGNGLVLKKTEFGKHHNYDLRLIDNISIYNYDNKLRLDSIEDWQTDYFKNISLKYYTLNEYDSLNNIISDVSYKAKTDSIIFQCEYIYHENLLQKKRFSNEVIELEYDSNNQLIQWTDFIIEDSIIHAKIKYLYSNDTIYTFLSQGSPDNFRPSDITTNNGRNQILCNLPASDTISYALKTTYDYNKKGFLTKINYYRLAKSYKENVKNGDETKYWKPEYYIEIKIKNRKIIKDFEAINRMNLSIMEEY